MRYGLAGLTITAAVMLLPETPAAQARLNHSDILGRWCGATGVYVIDRRQILKIPHIKGARTRWKVRHFRFGRTRIMLQAITGNGRPAQLHFLDMRPLGPSFRLLKERAIYRRC